MSTQDGTGRASGAERGTRVPTIHDLAAHAGVSTATVSRVLNGSPRVAAETRQRVLEAVETLGFQVNHAARSLRTSRSGLIGVLVPVISVFGRIVEEFDHDLAETGLSILLTASRRRQADRDIDAVEILVGRGVDALVLTPSDDQSKELRRTLQRVRPPIVLLDREVRGLDADLLAIDQKPAFDDAMAYLAAAGRRRIGLIARDGRTRPARQIHEVYRDANRRLGLAVDRSLETEFDDLDRATARDAVDALRAAGADAIICTGTMEDTATVLERLSELGVAVPRDISLVVYGYVGGATATYTGLPTVAYQVDRIAHAISRLVLARLHGSTAPPRMEVVPNVFLAPQPRLEAGER
jgi:LacI family transcriptional regulator